MRELIKTSEIFDCEGAKRETLVCGQLRSRFRPQLGFSSIDCMYIMLVIIEDDLNSCTERSCRNRDNDKEIRNDEP